jgi:hypothetical protein
MPLDLTGGNKLAAAEGLKQAEDEHPDDVAFSVTTDGRAEIEGTVQKGRLTLTGYAAAKLKGAKEFAAGIKGKFSFRKP